MYVKSETEAKDSEYYAIDTSGELYLLEGGQDAKWLSDFVFGPFSWLLLICRKYRLCVLHCMAESPMVSY